ncbi:MAG: tetratricopeptide repeat protein [Acidobacteria bacterium]|nr:tetratricopeptide repeat protein [Acidobacteriota bacterium]
MTGLTKTAARLTALAMVLAWGVSMPALGQVRAVKGKVLDEQDKPLSGAKVTISGMDIKRNYTTKTNDKGEYFYGGLTTGRYYVGVELEGFQCDFVQGISPAANEPAVVDFKLRPGGCGKLPFLMTEEEKKKLAEQQEEAKKQQAMASLVKVDFEAGLAAVQAGKYDEAIEAFKKALEKDQSQPYVWANLADAYGKKKNYQEAIAAFNKAIELKPDDPNLVQNLGNIYGASGDTAKAEEMYTKAASMPPAAAGGANAAASYYNLGVTKVNTGKLQEAIEAFNKAIEADPNYAEAHYQLGVAYIGSGKSEEGIKALKDYLKLVQTGQNAETAKALISELTKM